MLPLDKAKADAKAIVAQRTQQAEIAAVVITEILSTGETITVAELEKILYEMYRFAPSRVHVALNGLANEHKICNPFTGGRDIRMTDGSVKRSTQDTITAYTVA